MEYTQFYRAIVFIIIFILFPHFLFNSINTLSIVGSTISDRKSRKSNWHNENRKNVFFLCYNIKMNYFIKHFIFFLFNYDQNGNLYCLKLFMVDIFSIFSFSRFFFHLQWMGKFTFFRFGGLFELKYSHYILGGYQVTQPPQFPFPIYR